MIIPSRFHGRLSAIPRRRGTTTVEVAIVISLFLLFMFGLIDIGRGFMVSHLLTDAARAGCRQGILPSKSNSDVTAAIKDLLAKEYITGGTTTITVNGKEADVATSTSGDQIGVTVAVPVNDVTWLPVSRFLSGNISGQFSLVRE